MAGERTAAELVAKVRELIKEKDQTPYRDGFAADVGNAAASFSILSALNTAQRMIASLGYLRESTDINTSVGIFEYALDKQVVRITAANLTTAMQTYPLRKIADRLIEPIISRGPSGQRARPRQWGSYSNHLILNPVPDNIYTVTVYNFRVAVDFTAAAPTATPEELPSYFHEMLAFGAALFLMSAEIENAAAQNRIPFLKEEWRRWWVELAAETKVQPVPPVPFVESSEYGRTLAGVV